MFFVTRKELKAEIEKAIKNHDDSIELRLERGREIMNGLSKRIGSTRRSFSLASQWLIGYGIEPSQPEKPQSIQEQLDDIREALGLSYVTTSAKTELKKKEVKSKTKKK